MFLIGSANVVVHHRYLLPKDSVTDIIFYKDLRICLFFIPGVWHLMCQSGQNDSL